MIGVVIVSHSAKLAEGVRELAEQASQGRVPLAVAGGVDDPQNPIGTDAEKVLRAIESVYSDDGVLVLMDLGSAVLSAEVALELLPEDRRARVRLCPAPLVEGAVAAVTQAMGGGDIERIMGEAVGALAPKLAQVPGAASPTGAAPPRPEGAPSPDEVVLTVRNALGLHARPAAQFVRLASRFRAQIIVRNLSEGSGPFDAKSINQVLILGARQGHRIAISAQGPDSREALAALAALAEEGFGEAELPAAPGSGALPPRPTQPIQGALTGLGASPGIAIGPLRMPTAMPTVLAERHTGDPQGEIERLRAAIQDVQAEIRALREHARIKFGGEHAAIFDAHQLFLEDATLVGAALQRIAERQESAEAAWRAAIEAVAADYRVLKDDYLQARAADLADVGQRVLQRLAGDRETLNLRAPGILVKTELSASECARLDPTMVWGICTALGNPNAHSAILARALGIPMVVGLGPAIMQLSDGTPLAMDGERGVVWVQPDAQTLATLTRQREAWQAMQRATREASRRPACTRDGRRVHVMANIRGLDDVRLALDCGAEGVGLLRSEFLYMGRAEPPDEEEQVAQYRAIAEALGPRPLVIRTLDVGGDKPLPYLAVAPEPNPFLGWRGIRIMLERPDLLKAQLRAILRASVGHTVRIMLPMISTLAEVRAARAILAEAQAELRRANLPFDENVELGIMIEVPSAAAIADQLAAEVAFFSIGTNDLSQYVMAADRTHARVGPLADAMHPAVLRTVSRVVQSAQEARVRVALCGELAGDPLAAPLLVGMGLDELSMNPPAIPKIKVAIAQLTTAEAQDALAEALTLDAAETVRRSVARRFPRLAA